MPPSGSPDRRGASAVVLYRACRVRAAPRCSAPSYYACARPTKGAAPRIHHRTFRDPLICPCHSDAHKSVAPATRTHSRHSREGRPLHNRHCRTSPTVIPAKAGIQGGAPGWRGLLHFHDLALHGELRKGLRRRESRVGLGGGASPSPVLPTHPRGDPAALPLQGRRASDPAKAGIQGGGAGHPLTLPCHPSVARTSTYVLVSPQHAKQAKEVAMPRKTINILRPVQLHFSAEKNRWQSYRRQQSNRAHRLNLRCG